MATSGANEGSQSRGIEGGRSSVSFRFVGPLVVGLFVTDAFVGDLEWVRAWNAQGARQQRQHGDVPFDKGATWKGI